jgi:lactate permease
VALLAVAWPQPLSPVHSLGVSAAVAAIPLAVVLVLMGGLRKSGLVASACGLATAVILALAVWRMPAGLAAWSIAFGFAYAAWSILWLVFGALWLYQLAVTTGSFDLLRRWMARHASGDACIQAMLVAFAFGALLEGSAGFGAPVAITAFLLVGLGYQARKAVVVALLANTAPVAFGALGVPIVALAGVTGLDTMKLSAMVGRQLPFLSFFLPAYLVAVVAGGEGLRRSWRAALVTGGTFAGTQCFVSNFWGPNATDVLSAIVAILALTSYLRITARAPEAADEELSRADSLRAWTPWLALSVIVVLWTYFKVVGTGQLALAIPRLHQGVFITLYNKPYAAVFTFQPLATGTGVIAAMVFTAICFRVRPRVVFAAGVAAVKQLRLPGVSIQLLGDGVHSGRGARRVGRDLSAGQQLSRVGGLFSQRQRYLGEPVVRKSAGGGGAAVASEPGADGGDQFVGRGRGKDDLAAKHRHWRQHGGTDRAGGKRSAPDLLAQRGLCGIDRRDCAVAGVCGAGDGAVTRARALEGGGDICSPEVLAFE